MIATVYSNFYDRNFSEYVVSSDFYKRLRNKCLDWKDLTHSQFYIYLYVRQANVTRIGLEEVEHVPSGYVIGFDFWEESDMINGSPPAGRMSTYGDEHLYVKVI